MSVPHNPDPATTSSGTSVPPALDLDALTHAVREVTLAETRGVDPALLSSVLRLVDAYQNLAGHYALAVAEQVEQPSRRVPAMTGSYRDGYRAGLREVLSRTSVGTANRVRNELANEGLHL